MCMRRPTLIYFNRHYVDIMWRERLLNAHMSVVHVLSDEQRDDCEYGRARADLLRPYTAAPDTLYVVCGPLPFNEHLVK
jgi:ferredoxin-NADP reductase